MLKLYNLKIQLRPGLIISVNNIKLRMSHHIYIYALHAHVPEILKLYKKIAYYTQQGMEKYNDRASKNYFRSKNHRRVTTLTQVFLKKQRIQYLEAAGYMRGKN